MSLKNMVNALKDNRVDAHERVFRLFVYIGMIGLAVADSVGVVTGESVENVIAMTAAFVVFFVIAFLTFHFRKIQIGAAVIGAIIIYLVVPVNFMTTGGLNGGGAIWMVFGIVYVGMAVTGRIKYVFLGTAIPLYAWCYYVAYKYPDAVTEHTVLAGYIDSLVSLIIVSVLICLMVLFQNGIYRSENQLVKKQKAEIEELNKAQNAFFSNMSHEIRTPINTIIGLNEMILREDVSDEVLSDARNIQGASKILLTLINDILDMSKMEAGKMDIVAVPYDVGSMLSELVNMIWVSAQKKGLAFHIDVDPAIPAQLYGDEVRIKQILINVLNNAVKYTQEGEVTLSIQCSEQDGDDISVIYSVTDTGIGIKKENIPYLFTTFRRVDEEKNRYIEGTGLGLSIVKQLTDLMGGTISVNSVYTKGSTFVITIPQRKVGDEKLGKKDLGERYTAGKRELYRQSFEAPKARVLIVDDNEMNLVVAQKLLRETKVQTEALTSGADCLKATLQTHYDVILMDHLMPEMDGIECLHAIRAQKGGLNRETPIVALTANADSESQQLYRNEGFDGYLLKPVSGAQLEQEILRHLPEELVVMDGDASDAGRLETPFVTHKQKTLIRITTDSVSDLPKRLRERYRIEVLPYRVCTGNGEFLDEIETDSDGLLEYLKDETKKVSSKAPETEDYVKFFAEQLTTAQYVIHIAMAKGASVGYQNATEAAQTFDNVLVIDSGQLSSGMGLLAICAAQYAETGMEAAEIAEKITRMRSKVQTSFILDDTSYLMRSGRLSPTVSNLCEALMLHPVIRLKNSSMKPGSIWAGTQKTVRKRYINASLDLLNPIDRSILFITYVGLSDEELKWIAQEVEKKVLFKEVIFQKASPAISTNCGPGCFGLLFLMK